MKPTRPRLAKAAALIVAVLGAAAGCAAPNSDVAEATTTMPTTTMPTTTTTLTEVQPGSSFGPDSAIEVVRSVSEISVGYANKGATTGEWDRAILETAAAYLDSSSVSVDVSALDECSRRQGAVTAATVVDVYELAYEAFAAHEVEADLWIVAYRVVEVVPGVSDSTTDRAIYLTSNGIIGERSPGPLPDESCWNSAITRTDVGSALFAAAIEADNGDLNPVADTGGSASSVPADPADPEPIQSTGSDKRDVLRVGDPSIFECLSYVGRGPEEILSRDKTSYENVPDAFLFVAYFSDGTSIDIRVHPEVGTIQEVTTEVGNYTTPLGQLPTALRRDIARFAIRSGDATATASPLEGISMQTGNTAVRLADDRLEETIFHESIHTSLDPVYVYGNSTEWFDAQNRDRKFLTEYGRNNPVGEDLAETALYAYVLLHHPDRISAVDAALFGERIPNRIAFIESILPPDQPTFEPTSPSPPCEDS